MLIGGLVENPEKFIIIASRSSRALNACSSDHSANRFRLNERSLRPAPTSTSFAHEIVHLGRDEEATRVLELGCLKMI